MGKDKDGSVDIRLENVLLKAREYSKKDLGEVKDLLNEKINELGKKIDEYSADTKSNINKNKYQIDTILEKTKEHDKRLIELDKKIDKTTQDTRTGYTVAINELSKEYKATMAPLKKEIDGLRVTIGDKVWDMLKIVLAVLLGIILSKANVKNDEHNIERLLKEPSHKTSTIIDCTKVYNLSQGGAYGYKGTHKKSGKKL